MDEMAVMVAFPKGPACLRPVSGCAGMLAVQRRRVGFTGTSRSLPIEDAGVAPRWRCRSDQAERNEWSAHGQVGLFQPRATAVARARSRVDWGVPAPLSSR